MEYVVYGFWSVWYLDCFFLETAYVLWHYITLHCMAFGVMSRTYGCDRTGTTSFIGHNDVASYIVGYEGRSSYASICIHHWFGIEVQLRTMGMKAGIHVH